MKDLLATIQAIKDALKLLLAAQRVTVVTTSPLTIQLQDGTSIRGVAITGLTYTSGGPAIALIADRGQPIVLPTT